MRTKNHILLLALFLLVVGVLYYLLVRDSIVASRWFGISSWHQNFIAIRVDWLPSFVHQFSFVILTWLALDRKYIYFPLGLWFSINIIFELGQALPKDYRCYFPKVISDYFKYGTYSESDMYAIFVATIMAYFYLKKQES